MCGITGIVSQDPSFQSKEIIQRMAKRISHRGPDNIGIYSDQYVALANTRLSIIDIEGGNQPFFSKEKDIVVIQNGEIYNYLEVKEELIQEHNVEFKSHSDTEVILKAFMIFGKKFVTRLNGMFSIAILDKRNKSLFLYRDRLGVKPLYFYSHNQDFIFSSEIKSFLEYPNFRKEINFQAIHNFLVLNYSPVPDTMFCNVKHLKPGHYIELNLDNYEYHEKEYWNLSNTHEVEDFSEEALIDKVHELLIDAVRIRLRSDVEIGAFLSGGLDSSLVCAIAAKDFSRKLESFSIGFEESKFDESNYAREVSRLYNLKNNVHYMQSSEIELWDKVTYFNDQPHGDISFIPTFVLSKFAAEKYKVVFTGDGGDEVFGGYTKYFDLLKYNSESESFFNTLSLFKEKGHLISDLYSKSFKSKVNLSSAFDLYQNSISSFSKKDNINKGLLFDVKHLLPGNNLIKPDKMAMANSLETRSPLMDYRLYELMYSLPGSFKVGEGMETKYILKKLALRYLPRDIVYRDKQMFTVPVGEWFKSQLKDYLLAVVKSNDLAQLDIFNLDFLESMALKHISGEANFTRELRAISNLDIWLKQFSFS